MRKGGCPNWVAVMLVLRWHLDPDIWLSPLMILGTQWYLLFNVIAGASTVPGELRLAARNLGLKGWLKWRRYLLPAVFPSFVTGAITASGGSWNASIVAEYVTWGDTTLKAQGIGAYIAEMTATGGVGALNAQIMGVDALLRRAESKGLMPQVIALQQKKRALEEQRDRGSQHGREQGRGEDQGRQDGTAQEGGAYRGTRANEHARMLAQ